MFDMKRHAKLRTPIQIAYDAVCWAVAVLLATALRYDLELGRVDVGRVIRILPLLVGAQIVAGLLFGMYRGRWRFGSFDEVLALAQGVAATSAATFTANLLMDPSPLPRSVPLAAGLIALVLMGAGRYAWRLTEDRRLRPQAGHCERLLVFGAGDAGVKIVTSMLRNPGGRYLPVALLDDDPAKRNLRVMGVPVVGNRADMARAAANHHADALLIALPSAGSSLITELSEVAVTCRLPVKVLPPVDELLDGRVESSDIRDVTPADILGRHEVHTDIDSIAGYLTGRRVLVTGAGGSIGSELCRQIYRFAPAELVMVDRDESALHAVQLSIEGRALLDSPDLVLLDLRDRAATERLLRERQPQVVFHAAALKHLPLLERHPAEAVKTNIWATLDLLEAAVATGVERFVNISTDKAADPTSVLGYSKRITERLTAYMTTQGATTCLSVRFGNVVGSRGSVLTTFRTTAGGSSIFMARPSRKWIFTTVFSLSHCLSSPIRSLWSSSCS